MAYLYLFGDYSSDFYDLVDKIEESFAGDYSHAHNPKEDYAMEIMEETMEIPDHLQGYIDYEKFARDLFMGDYSEHNGLIFHCI